MTSNSRRGRPRHDDVLTPAEWRVAEAVRHGLGNAEIARRQGVSSDAVKFHVANVLQKLGLARRSDLRHWTGIRRDSVLFGKESAMMRETKLGAIGQIARTVRDLEAAKAWYGGMLGLPHLYSFGKLAFFDCDGVRLLLSEGGARANESMLYFRVPDIHVAHAALSARGVEFLGAPHRIHRHDDGTEEWLAPFNDNEGRPLSLIAQLRS